MLFDKITPEEAGIESRYIADYVSVLERHGMTTHSLLMMKGEKIFAEYSWAPFHRDFLHRMYSQTKSYVSIAIGLLMDEGKVSLDAPIVSYFPDKIRRELSEYLEKQTVRDMLMMETAVRPPYWFGTANPDRTDEYTLYVECSKGTYIRTLCADMGNILGCGAAMCSLQRTKTGAFTLEDAYTLEQLNGMEFEQRLALLCPIEKLFSTLPAVNLGDFFAHLAHCGCHVYQKKLKTDYAIGDRVRLCDKDGFFALGEVREYEDGTAIKPIKQFKI